MRRFLLPLILSFLASPSAQAARLLGETTPFSKSQSCRQIGCKLLSETKVGAYVVYTYRVRETGDTNLTFFAIKKNERNVALGYANINGGGAGSDGINTRLGYQLAQLLSLPRPDLKRFAADEDGTLPKEKPFSVPLDAKTLLTNRSAFKPSRTDEEFDRLGRGIATVYAVQKAEADAVARIINRQEPQAKAAMIASLKKQVGVSGECKKGYRDARGKLVKTDRRIFETLRKWEETSPNRGMLWANAVGYNAFTLPGLSQTEIGLWYNFDYPKAFASGTTEEWICFF